MESREAIYNNKKVNVLIKLDEDFKDDLVLSDLDDTMDLSEILENTQTINSGDISE